MARRFQQRSTPKENLRIVLGSLPWKLLVLIPVLLALAIPTYVYGSRLGSTVFPSLTHFFYNLSASAPPATPTPLPAFPSAVPQVGSLSYVVQDGDSCDAMLSYQMQMRGASHVFSDVMPETVKALNDSLGQDCHKLQPGMTLLLSPQYPLVAIGGQVMKIDAPSPQEVLPTPLIPVPNQTAQVYSPDCSDGCNLTVKMNGQTQVQLVVKTTLSVHVGSWVWTQALMERKKIAGFDAYPYADPQASFNGMKLQACDFQADDVHDDNAQPCSKLQPNTIVEDTGAWLFAVTGPSALDHWKYPVHLPPNTHVLLWLSLDDGTLAFHSGNPIYQYNENKHIYEKV